MAASTMFRLARASDTGTLGGLVSLALHVGVLAAYALLSHSPRLALERSKAMLTVEIIPVPAVETEPPSVPQLKTTAAPAIGVTLPHTPSPAPAVPAVPVPQMSETPDRAEEAAPPDVAIPLPASGIVGLPLPAPVASVPDSDTRATYVRRVWEWIAVRRPPGIHLEGEAVISFSIDSDGHLRELSLVRSSGNAQLDRLALRTVRLAAPFPRPPESLDVATLDFALPFHFN